MRKGKDPDMEMANSKEYESHPYPNPLISSSL